LLNCRWPGDRFLHPVDENCWSDQANTCWTGVELAFASFLMYEGLTSQALAVVRNVDERYRKAGMYFDHQEFGGHYFRAMSAWGLINAALGLSINGQSYTFAPRLDRRDLKLFFVFGAGSAHYERSVGARSEQVSISVNTGTLRCRQLTLTVGRTPGSRAAVMIGRRKLGSRQYSMVSYGDTVTIRFPRALSLAAGKRLTVTL
jgi:hypothetical protein